MVRGEAALTRRGFIIDKKKNPLEPRVFNSSIDSCSIKKVISKRLIDFSLTALLRKTNELEQTDWLKYDRL